MKQTGTPEFMAPEVYYGEPYGPMVDWWCLGHIIWDMLVDEVGGIFYCLGLH